MAEIKTDIVTMTERGDRIRTTNYRGSVLETTCLIETNSTDSDVLYISKISPSTVIKSLKIFKVFPPTDTNKAAYIKYNLYGIESDNPGLYTEIKTDIPVNPTKTISEELLDADNKFIKEYKPFEDDAYLMLGVSITSTNAASFIKNAIIRLRFVEGNPSSTIVGKSIKRKKVFV